MDTASNPPGGDDAGEEIAQPQSAAKPAPRPFVESDIPAIVALHHEVMSPSEKAPASFFRDRFLKHPWRDDSTPSWVYTNEESEITGFIGVIPRTFMLGNRQVKAAFTTKFMVAPDARGSKAGIALFRKFIDGPQQLSFADVTNHSGVLFWQAFGGLTVPIYSMEWRRSLRRCPSRRIKPRSGLLSSLAKVYRPWIDRVAQRIYPAPVVKDPDVIADAFDCAEIVEALPKLIGSNTLYPQYDADSLAWSLRILDEAPDLELMHRSVRSQDGTLIGWFVYAISNQTAQVVQLTAYKRQRDRVLDAMFRHAATHGVADMVGRLDSTWLPLLSDRPDITCNFRGYSMMIRSDDVELSERILRGDMHISPLDGELLTQFHHER
jgi:hypothetical protein